MATKQTVAMTSAQHEAEHVLAAHVPPGLNFQVAGKAGFDWKSMIDLLAIAAPTVLQIVMDVIGGMKRPALIEKYTPAMHTVIDAVLAKFKG